MDIVTGYMLPFIYAAMACAGFCVMYNMHDFKISLAACVGGGLAWVAYLLCAPSGSVLCFCRYCGNIQRDYGPCFQDTFNYFSYCRYSAYGAGGRYLLHNEILYRRQHGYVCCKTYLHTGCCRCHCSGCFTCKFRCKNY